MAGDDVRLWFDQAYIHMASGDFASAAKCFEHVIKDARDPYASQIAEQRLRWYCVPLEAILKRMQECHTPIDVHTVIEELFTADPHYLESEHQSIFQIVDAELAKLTSVIRVGNKVWVKQDIFNHQLEKLAQAILQSSSPLSVSAWLRNQFHNCEPPSNYPDHITLGVFESGLHEYPIDIFAQEFAISRTALAARIDSLVTHIRDIGQPVPLNSLIEILFPEESSELASQIVHFLKGRLDARFIEVTQGKVFLNELLKLNNDPFEDIFLISQIPLTTEKLVCSRLFPGQTTLPLTQQFQSIAEHQLAHNQNLRQTGQSHWISKMLERDLYAQAENYLLKEGTPQSSQTILEKIWPTDSIENVSRNLLINLLDDALSASQNVIMVGNQIWIHLAIVKKAVDKSYQQLLLSPKPLTTNELLTSTLGLAKAFYTRILFQKFENLLLKDARFISETNRTPQRWQAVDPRKRDNRAVYQVLRQARKWLSLEEIGSLLITGQGIPSPTFDLESDDHFRPFPPTRWGLKEWVSINNLAYEYLLASRQALHEIAIRGLICTQNGIKEENAIFSPLEDPRFAQDSLNRWFCRHSLTATEIELLHEELIKYGGSGRKLDILTRQVLHLHPDSTDAQGRLQADERFIDLDGLWFAHQAAFYPLTPTDVEKIYGALATQADFRTAIPLKELVYQAIGHDGRLTDAPTWLRQDERFKEVHEGFWALSSSPDPDFDRSGTGRAAVHRPSTDEGAEDGDSSSTAGKLTPRKGRSAIGKAIQEPQKKVYITLSHLDILHGNLRIAGLLKHWIPVGANNVHFRDEEDYEFIAYIDETGSILNIREWLEKCSLTYGDKISIQPASQINELFIRPYGKRDERVYQEALDHQEIEKLIDEARRVNKNFHDLMIEVLEAFDYPLHREDIYQLVNYQRTATRNTISEILSLPDCPFKELRYFVPVGAGNWKFDRKRKEAYDMKMQELLTENGALQDQLINLQAQLESQKGSPERNPVLSAQLEQFQHMIAETNGKNERLQKDKNAVELINSELQKELEALRKQMTKLQSEIEEGQATSQQIQNQVHQEKTQLQERINTLASQVDSLQNQAKEIQERAAFETKEVQGKLETQTKELEHRSIINRSLEAELVTVQASKERIQKEIDQVRGESVTKAGKLEADLAAAQANNECLQREIEQLRGESAAKAGKLDVDLATTQSNDENLQKEIEQLRRESTIRISQLEAELAAAQIKMEQAKPIASSPAPSKIKEIIHAISKLLFGQKS